MPKIKKQEIQKEYLHGLPIPSNLRLYELTEKTKKIFENCSERGFSVFQLEDNPYDDLSLGQIKEIASFWGLHLTTPIMIFSQVKKSLYILFEVIEN